MILASFLLVLAGTSPAAPAFFDVTARFVPGKSAGAGEVAVTFVPRDPDVKVNEHPAPRLTLDPTQKLLVDKPVKAAARPAASAEPAYLDLTLPVVFPVAVAAPKPATVRGNVTYFYCSKRDGWCRKGTSEVEVSVGTR